MYRVITARYVKTCLQTKERPCNISNDWRSDTAKTRTKLYAKREIWTKENHTERLSLQHTNVANVTTLSNLVTSTSILKHTSSIWSSSKLWVHKEGGRWGYLECSWHREMIHNECTHARLKLKRIRLEQRVQQWTRRRNKRCYKLITTHSWYRPETCFYKQDKCCKEIQWSR